LIAALCRVERITPMHAQALSGAHATLLAAGLACTLDRRPRLVAEDAAITAARSEVSAVIAAHGLAFAIPPADAAATRTSRGRRQVADID